jgi:hypothetical protein
MAGTRVDEPMLGLANLHEPMLGFGERGVAAANWRAECSSGDPSSQMRSRIAFAQIGRLGDLADRHAESKADGPRPRCEPVSAARQRLMALGFDEVSRQSHCWRFGSTTGTA